MRNKIVGWALLISIGLCIFGFLWGGLAQMDAEWNHALSNKEKVDVWVYLWISPASMILLGIIIIMLINLFTDYLEV